MSRLKKSCLNKNHGYAPKLRQCAVTFDREGMYRLDCLNHRADALGAQRLLGLGTLLINGHLLQIREELAIGSPQRERAVVTKSGGLATVSAFSHRDLSFLAIIPLSHQVQARNFTTKRILLQVKCLYSRKGLRTWDRKRLHWEAFIYRPTQ
jgi:hypothetical protein